MGDPGAFNTYYPTLLRYIGLAIVLCLLIFNRFLGHGFVPHRSTILINSQ